MNIELKSLARGALPLALCCALVPATAQTAREQADKELARKPPVGGVQACSLVTRAEVSKAPAATRTSIPSPPAKAAASATSASVS